MSSSEIPVGLRAAHARDVVLVVEARTLGNRLKEAHVRMVAPPAEAVTIRCDEGARLFQPRGGVLTPQPAAPVRDNP